MIETDTPIEIVQRTPEEIAAQKSRNRWLGIALFVFVILVGVTTTIRLQDANLGKDGGFYFDGSMNVGGETSSPPPPIPFEEPAE